MKRFDVGVLAIAVAVLTLLGCAKGVADGAARLEVKPWVRLTAA